LNENYKKSDIQIINTVIKYHSTQPAKYFVHWTDNLNDYRNPYIKFNNLSI